MIISCPQTLPPYFVWLVRFLSDRFLFVCFLMSYSPTFLPPFFHAVCVCVCVCISSTFKYPLHETRSKIETVCILFIFSHLKIQNKEQKLATRVPTTKHLHVRSNLPFVSITTTTTSPYLMYDSPPLDHYTPCDSI
eukprot:807617_1